MSKTFREVEIGDYILVKSEKSDTGFSKLYVKYIEKTKKSIFFSNGYFGIEVPIEKLDEDYI